MTEHTERSGGLRAMTRDMVRQRLSETAIDLFAEHGFGAVTVEEIASAAGVSVRSVHRYFPAKEDMVIGSLAAHGDIVRVALEARPADESVVKSLHAAFASMLRTRPQTSRDKVAICLLSSTPSLQARNTQKHLAWAEMLEPVVSSRLASDDASLRSRVLVQVGLGALSVALAVWAEEHETRELHDLLEVAFRTIEHA